MSLLIGSNVDLQHACAHACGLNIDAKYNDIYFRKQNKFRTNANLSLCNILETR